MIWPVLALVGVALLVWFRVWMRGRRLDYVRRMVEHARYPQRWADPWELPRVLTVGDGVYDCVARGDFDDDR